MANGSCRFASPPALVIYFRSVTSADGPLSFSRGLADDISAENELVIRVRRETASSKLLSLKRQDTCQKGRILKNKSAKTKTKDFLLLFFLSFLRQYEKVP